MPVLPELFSRIPQPVLHVVARRASNVTFVRRAVTEAVVDRYSFAAPPRPRATSMAADYPTWNGLVDRRFSGRHLGRSDASAAPAQPPVEALIDVFVRRAFKPAADTSILFAFFAQWFTDGFLRTKWEPDGERRFRQNESNHEIDLCQIYGAAEDQATMLRERSDDPARRGRLKSQLIDGEEWPSPLMEQRDGHWVLRPEFAGDPQTGRPSLYSPANFERVFSTMSEENRALSLAVGLEHGNSTVGHVLMNTLFLRDHNRTAGIIAAAHPDWDDERVFQTARNVTIAVLLHIVVSDYIVHIAPIDFKLEITPGIAERKRWYRTNWIPVEFALLYRWHDLIPDELVVGTERIDARQFRHATGWIRRNGIDAVLEAASGQAAGRIGLGNTHAFLAEDRPDGPNVKRLSIEMERACALQGFNAYRRHYGLRPYRDFESLTRDPAAAARLRTLYGHVDRLEWFTGLFAEGYGERDMMGELMVTMVANDAFTQALTNPLLSRCLYGPEAFSAEGFAIVEETRRLGQVIARNTRLADPGGDSFTIRPRAPAG